MKLILDISKTNKESLFRNSISAGWIDTQSLFIQPNFRSVFPAYTKELFYKSNVEKNF